MDLEPSEIDPGRIADSCAARERALAASRGLATPPNLRPVSPASVTAGDIDALLAQVSAYSPVTPPPDAEPAAGPAPSLRQICTEISKTVGFIQDDVQELFEELGAMEAKQAARYSRHHRMENVQAEILERLSGRIEAVQDAVVAEGRARREAEAKVARQLEAILARLGEN